MTAQQGCKPWGQLWACTAVHSMTPHLRQVLRAHTTTVLLFAHCCTAGGGKKRCRRCLQTGAAAPAPGPTSKNTTGPGDPAACDSCHSNHSVTPASVWHSVSQTQTQPSSDLNGGNYTGKSNQLCVWHAHTAIGNETACSHQQQQGRVATATPNR